jgi:type IV pilus assembly protein PilM
MADSELRLRQAANGPGASGPLRIAAVPAPAEQGPESPGGWHWRRGTGAALANPPLLRLTSRLQVGVDMGSRWIKYAVVKHQWNRASVVAAGGAPIAGDARGELGKIRARIRALATVRDEIGRKDARWIVSIGGTGTMVRTVEVPRMPQRELRAAVLWQAQKKFPFPLEDARVAITYLKTPPRQPVKAVVAAALKRQIEDFLFLFAEADIKPSALVLPAFGMAEALRTTGPIAAGEFNGVINIGAERSLFAVYRGTSLEFFRELDVGTGDVEQALSHDVQSGDRAERLDAAHLSRLLFRGDERGSGADARILDSGYDIQTALEKLVLEIQSTLEYYAAQSGGLRINRFLLAGGGACIAGIGPHLENLLEIPVLILEPALPGLLPEGVESEGLAHPAIWSGALGHALLPRRVPNLLPEEFIRSQEEHFRMLVWRSATGAALGVALLLSGAEYYRAGGTAARLADLETRSQETSRRLQEIGVGQLETTLAAHERWSAALRTPDLRASSVMRIVAALTPSTIALDRVDVAVADSGFATASLAGEVRTDHAQNEVVLAGFVQALRESGFFKDVALSDYRTVRRNEYEQITFSVTCRVPLEQVR